jgi:putative FmdB family regulatory protein
MPAYDFACQSCGERFSVSVKISEKNDVVCPKCSSREIEQRFTSVGVVSRSEKSASKPSFRPT